MWYPYIHDSAKLWLAVTFIKRETNYSWEILSTHPSYNGWFVVSKAWKTLFSYYSSLGASITFSKIGVDPMSPPILTFMLFWHHGASGFDILHKDITWFFAIWKNFDKIKCDKYINTFHKFLKRTMNQTNVLIHPLSWLKKIWDWNLKFISLLRAYLLTDLLTIFE